MPRRPSPPSPPRSDPPTPAPTQATAPEMRAAAESPLLQRLAFGAATQLTTFNGLRNVDLTLGYAPDLTPTDYRRRYERGGIAERIVEAYPRATWAAGADVQEDPDPAKITKFEERVNSIFNRLRVWEVFRRADILMGLGHYSVIYIGAKGAPETPLSRNALSGERLLYLFPYSEESAKIERFNDDASDPRYGLPEFYTLSTSVFSIPGASASRRNLQRRVHWSRVLHVVESPLDNDVFGKPRLRAVWNLLDDLAKIVGGGAEAAWRRMDPGLHVDIDPAVPISPAEREKLSAEIDDYVHGLRRVLRTRGVEINPLSASVSEFGGNMSAILDLVSATTGIPQRILTGSERGELASTQDRSNWSDRIAERRQDFARSVVGGFIQRLQVYGDVPEIDVDTPYTVVWPDTEELTESEKATVVGALAAANAAQKGAEGTIIMTANEIRDRVLGLDELDEVEQGAQTADMGEGGGGESGGAQPGTNTEDDEDADSADPELRAARAAAATAQTPALTAADANTPLVARVFSAAFEDARRTVDLTALETAIASGSRDEIEQTLHAAITNFGERLDAVVPRKLVEAVRSK